MKKIIAPQLVQDNHEFRRMVAVIGPTGSGKTKLGVALAKKFNGIIISADSRQVYQGLDIGTNKEGDKQTWEGLECRTVDGIPQLLIDIVEPGQRFTLNDWLIQARYVLELIIRSDKVPIVVGGTGLYVTALLEGYQPGGGRFAKNNQPVDFQSLILKPEVDREILNKKSDERCDRIFDAVVAETERLIASGVPSEWLEKIGLDYRYAFKGIKSQLNREIVIEQFQRASRAFIRRQMTWWRHHGEVVEVKSRDEAFKKVGEFLNK